MGTSNTDDPSSHVLYLTSAGCMGIGTITPGFQLEVAGSLGTAGKPGGGSWATSSDERLKENVSPFTYGLNTLLQVNPVNYNYNSLADTSAGFKGIGLIAQDIQTIAPYTVGVIQKKLHPSDKDTTDILSFDPSALLYVSINAIKELNQDLQSAQSQLNTLMGGSQVSLSVDEAKNKLNFRVTYSDGTVKTGSVDLA